MNRIEDGRTRSWWWMENRVVDELWIAYLGVHAWAVFTVLVRHADARGRTNPSGKQIADITGISLREVRRSLKVLLGSGLVKRAKKGGPKESTVYQIRDTPPSKNLKGERAVKKQPAPSTPRQYKQDSTERFLAQLDQFEVSLPTPEPTPTPQSPARRKHRLPESWTPNDKHAVLAGREGVDLGREVEAFRDHAQATGRVMLDWDAAFRTWLKNARQFSKGYYGNGGPTFEEKAAKQEVERFYEEEALV